MKIISNNYLHNSCAQIKNNKTKNGMTNSVSFKAPRKTTLKNCKQAANGLAQSAQTLASEAMANINRVLVRKNEKRISSNNIEEQKNSPKVQDDKEIVYDEYKNKITLIGQKYDEKTQNRIFCKNVIKEYEKSSCGSIDKDIYKNAKFDPISGKIKSCDKLICEYNKNGDNALLNKAIYVKPKFNPNAKYPIKSFIQKTMNFLNNNNNKNKINQVIQTNMIRDDNNSKLASCEKIEKIFFKTRGVINEVFLGVKKREYLFADKIIQTHKGGRNGLCQTIYKNARFKCNDDDYYSYDLFGSKGLILINKSTEKKLKNTEPKYYLNGELKSCYKLTVFNGDSKLMRYINPKFKNDGTIESCDEVVYDRTIPGYLKESYINPKFYDNRNYDTLDKKNIKSYDKNIVDFYCNNEHSKQESRHIIYENPKYYKNSQLEFCEKLTQKTSTGINNNQIEEKIAINIKLKDSGATESCEQFSILRKKLNANGEYDIVESQTFKNPQFDENGKLISYND